MGPKQVIQIPYLTLPKKTSFLILLRSVKEKYQCNIRLFGKLFYKWTDNKKLEILSLKMCPQLGKFHRILFNLNYYVSYYVITIVFARVNCLPVSCNYSAPAIPLLAYRVTINNPNTVRGFVTLLLYQIQISFTNFTIKPNCQCFSSYSILRIRTLFYVCTVN
jgi:hypothetical protein